MDVEDALETLRSENGDAIAALTAVFDHVRSFPLSTSVRDMGLPLSLLDDCLLDSMEDRAAVVLPHTQEEVDLQENWIAPLTDRSGIAAAIYAEVLSRPGALTWVQMQAVSSLANSLYRWRTMMQGEKSVQNEDDWGLCTARALLQIPLQQEFRTCWPLAAVESILQTVISTLATTHALKHSELHLEIGHCLVETESFNPPRDDDDVTDEIPDNTNDPVYRTHQMVVTILRGIFPIFVRKEELANGEQGKTAAAKAAECVLRDLISGIQDTPAPKSNRKRLLEKDRDSPSSSIDSSDAVTPKPLRIQHPQSRTPRTRRATLTPKTKSPPRSESSAVSLSLATTPTSAVVGLLQKLATAPELQKSSIRASVTDLIVQTTKDLDEESQRRVISFLEKLCFSKISVHRLVAGELIGKIVQADWMTTHCQSSLVQAVQGRIADKAATVRATACAAITSIVRTLEASEVHVDLEELTDKLRFRAVADEKANVRRAACNALVTVLLHTRDVETEDVAILSKLCCDDSVQMRRSAAEGLTNIVEQFPDIAASAWGDHVLPLMHDSGCAAKASELIDRVILEPVLSHSNDDLAWTVLSSLNTRTGQNQMDALGIALRGSANARLFRMLKDKSIAFLDSGEDHQLGVWRLFLAATGGPKDRKSVVNLAKRSKVNFSFLGTCLSSFLEGEPKVECAQNCLGVLTQLAPCVDEEVSRNMTNMLLTYLGDFQLTHELIGAAISGLTGITMAQTSDTTQCSQWVEELYKHVDSKLTSMVARLISDQEAELLSRAMITAGELSLVGFSPTEEQGYPDDGIGDSTILACGLHVRPSSRIVDLIVSFMTKEIPGLDGVPVPHAIRAHAFTAVGKICLRDSILTKKILNILAQELECDSHWSVQSNALIILGDLCVRYTNMADKFLPNMAACLQAGATRIGASTTFPSIPGTAIVRKHAILVLSSLILQDFIKWRGLLFYRFLVATVDADESVACLAESILNGPLLSKKPTLFSTKFVESLFVLNNCTAHSMSQAAALAGEAGSGVSVGLDGIELRGEVGRSYRMAMYEMLLLRMTDEEKIAVTARLGKEVFGSALKPGSELHEICITDAHSQDESYEGTYNVLSDAFSILKSPAIRVGKKAAKDDEDDIVDPNVTNDKAKRVQAAKGRLLSNVSRKHLIETLLPILINLKSLLEEHRSPLLKDLMACILDVYKRFKAEAKECLANDPTILEELEFDARGNKAGKTPATGRRKSASSARTPKSASLSDSTARLGSAVQDTPKRCREED